jgi:hypothetical protein
MMTTPCTSRDKHGNVLHQGDFISVAKASRVGETAYAITRDADGALLASCFVRRLRKPRADRSERYARWGHFSE